MGKIKPGHVRHQLDLEEASEINEDLLAYARKRGLKPAQANRCILADWSDAYRGRPNPFAAYLPTFVQGTSSSGQEDVSQVEEETPEQRERREKEKAAVSQFD